MLIPGSNLLNIAHGVIGFEEGLLLSRALDRTPNAVGQYITAYAPQEAIEGSWQPVDLARVAMMGLDTAKSYYTLFTSEVVKSINRGESPDVIEWKGMQFTAVGDTPWSFADGWMRALFVCTGAAP